jgi:hypothetical protein
VIFIWRDTIPREPVPMLGQDRLTLDNIRRLA